MASAATLGHGTDRKGSLKGAKVVSGLQPLDDPGLGVRTPGRLGQEGRQDASGPLPSSLCPSGPWGRPSGEAARMQSWVRGLPAHPGRGASWLGGQSVKSP